MRRHCFSSRLVGSSHGARLFLVGSLLVATLTSPHAAATAPSAIADGPSAETHEFVDPNEGESAGPLSPRASPVPGAGTNSEGGELLVEEAVPGGEHAPSEDRSVNYFAFPPEESSAQVKGTYSAAAEEHALSEQLGPQVQEAETAKRRKATVRVSEAPAVVHSVENNASWRQTPTVRALLTTARLSTAKVSRWLQQRGGSYYNALKHRRELSVLAVAIVILAICIVRQEMRLHAYQTELETQEQNLEMLKRVEADTEAERKNFVRYVEKYEFLKEQLKQKEQEIASQEADLESKLQDVEALKMKDSKDDVELLLREDRVFQSGAPLRQMNAAFVDLLNLIQREYNYSPQEMAAELSNKGTAEPGEDGEAKKS